MGVFVWKHLETCQYFGQSFPKKVIVILVTVLNGPQWSLIRVSFRYRKHEPHLYNAVGFSYDWHLFTVAFPAAPELVCHVPGILAGLPGQLYF